MPGHTLQELDDVYGDSGNIIEFKKTDLIASAIADMLSQFPALPSDPDYSQATCERDLGLVADAIIADLRAGGNVKSIQAVFLTGLQVLQIHTPQQMRHMTQQLE